MALKLECKKEDSKTIIVYWQEEIWKELPKALFFNELKKLPSQLSWEEFLSAFSLLEEKIAKRQAIFLLSRRAYLSSDLEAKLKTKGLSQQAAAAAVQFCAEKGYLNDTREIERLIAKEQRKGLGTRAIYFKLKQQKKIDEKQLRQKLEQATGSEKEALEKWLNKEKRKTRLGNSFEEKQKLIAKAIRRGFSTELILTLLGE